MKKVIVIFFSILFICTSFVGCNDEDKEPLFVNLDESNNGVFVILEQETLVIDFTDESTSYDFNIKVPSSNVEKYELQLARTSEGIVSDTISVETVSSFPANFSFSASDLAGFLGLNSDDLMAGDRFDFIGIATGFNGEVANFQNLNSDATGPGQSQGFNHVAFLSCPFDMAELEGAYVIEDGGDAGIHNVGDVFEVISGPEENQYSIVGFGDVNLVINVDPDTGVSTPSDDVLITLDDDLELAPLPINSGFTFSCTGTISLTDLEYSCCEGAFPIIMSKQIL